MALIRWDPFSGLEDILEEEMTLLPKQKLSWDFGVDMYESDHNIISEINLPGVDPKTIDISIEADIIRISAQKEELKEKKEKHYYCKSIRRGSFDRTLRLPTEVNVSKTKADYSDGVLTLTMPIKEKTKAGKVKVKLS